MAPGLPHRHRRHPAGREAARDDDLGRRRARDGRAGRPLRHRAGRSCEYTRTSFAEDGGGKPVADGLQLRQRHQHRMAGRPRAAGDPGRMLASRRPARSEAIAVTFLPYGRQTIEDDDIAAVAEALRADFLTTGPTVERLRARLRAATVGAATRSPAPTAPRRCIWRCWRWASGPAMSASSPSITFLATANCARYVGAEVVFADVDPETGLMTPETLSGERPDRADPAGRPVPRRAAGASARPDVAAGADRRDRPPARRAAWSRTPATRWARL